MTCWSLCYWQEIMLDSCSSRTLHHGHMYFVQESLCSHTLSFTVHLELDWLDCLLPGNLFPNYCALNVLTTNCLVLDSSKYDPDWWSQSVPSFDSHLFLRLASLPDTYKDPLKNCKFWSEPIIYIRINKTCKSSSGRPWRRHSRFQIQCLLTASMFSGKPDINTEGTISL